MILYYSKFKLKIIAQTSDLDTNDRHTDIGIDDIEFSGTGINH